MRHSPTRQVFVVALAVAALGGMEGQSSRVPLDTETVAFLRESCSFGPVATGVVEAL